MAVNKVMLKSGEVLIDATGSTVSEYNIPFGIKALNAAGEMITGKGIFPSGYTRLLYIQSSGTQCINTNYKPKTKTRVETRIDFLSGNTSFNVIFGVGQTSTNQFTVYRNGSVMVGQVYSTTTYNTSGVVNEGLRDCVLSNKFFRYGEFQTAITPESFTYSYPLYIFALNSAGSITLHAKMRLYKFEIYEDETLVRNYVPCVNSAGVVGVYDTVNGVFYKNAGTGTFTKSQEVVTADDPELTAADALDLILGGETDA